jgi:PD-(D/E)XK endonuclease
MRTPLTPTEEGNIAETAIAARAVRSGIHVAVPISEGRRYELVFDTGDRLWRVQCKGARLRDEWCSCASERPG